MGIRRTRGARLDAQARDEVGSGGSGGGGGGRLAGRVALVTGGAGGMGAAIAREFRREGARVAIVDRDIEAASRLAGELSGEPGDDGCIALPADVSRSADADGAVARAVERLGRIDVLVNNAGARIVKPMLEHTDDDWNRMLSVNLSAQFWFARAVAPGMRSRGWGRILNIASIASFVGRPDRVAYCAAKAGVLGLTRGLAIDLRHSGVCVNAIAPGSIATPLNAQAADDPGVDWARETAVGRWGQGRDIARAAVYLASDDASYVNGTVLVVDGGWVSVKARGGELSDD